MNTPEPNDRSNDSPATPRISPSAPIGPGHLHPPTLRHFAEHPALAQSIGLTVERCLRTRTRFPHTLLVGDADTGKRSLAHAVAADLAVGLREIDMMHVTSDEELERALRAVPEGGILLVTGFEHAPRGAEVDLTRAMANRTRRVRRNAPTPESWMAAAEALASARPSEFTVIATSRRPLGSNLQVTRFFERTHYLGRTEAGEADRLRRCLRRAGIALAPDAASAVAAFVLAGGMRTLAAASMLTDFAEAHGLATLNSADVVPAMDAIFPACTPPATTTASDVVSDLLESLEEPGNDGRAGKTARGNAA